MRSPARGNKTMFFFLLYYLIMSSLIPFILIAMGFDDMIINIAIAQILGLFLPFLFYLLFTKQRQSDVLKWSPLGIKNTLLVIVIALAVIPMVQLVSYLSSFIFFPVIEAVMIDMTVHPMWLSLIVVAVFPSLFEELIFRGAIYAEYEGVSIKKAAIMTGLFFGIMHMNFHQAIYAGLFGILYAYILFYTRSIWAPILLHFINNGISVILSYWDAYMAWFSGISNDVPIFIGLYGVISLVLAPVLFLCLRKLKQNNKPHQEVDGAENIFGWAFWSIIGLFIIVAGLMEIGFRLM